MYQRTQMVLEKRKQPPQKASFSGATLVQVESESIPGEYYDVDLSALTCSCPDYQYRRDICKHIRRAQGATA